MFWFDREYLRVVIQNYGENEFRKQVIIIVI